MKVLVAEDNHDSRQLVRDILISLGHSAVLAENGKVALEKIDEDLPDLVILDVNMPEMDGFQVCEAIKTNPATAKVPVIMLTAQPDVDSRVTGLGLGADDYLPKPFHPRELMARIQARLRAKEETDSLREQREVLRRTFERFVAPEIVVRLLEDPTLVELGGAETMVTVMFADLEGFSDAAAVTAPGPMLEIVNRYHALLVEHIKANGGTIDKFMGDGIMALYNTPLPQPDHALRAIRTALSVHEALQEFHQQFEPLYRLEVNFGINSGMAIVGNVGTAEIMDFTALGDTVNLAQRLQSLSDHSEVTVSEDTYQLVADAVRVKKMKPRAVRGRDEPIVTYLVTGLK
ncbi:MAG: response regulator [Chloroflexi bacterium]|nr:response regulator [Chloroflexota bacterium]